VPMNKYTLDTTPTLGVRTTAPALGDPPHYVPGALIYEMQEDTGEATHYLYLKPEEVTELAHILLQASQEIRLKSAH